MNTSIETPTKPNLELLRRAVQEFQPVSSRIPFQALRPYHEFIVMLRAKSASYRSVAELLEKHGVHTSRARVAEYGRIVLQSGKKRKRQKRTKTAPAMTASTSAPAGNVTPPPKEDSPYRSHGPHIANVRMMTPSEREEFEASLKAKSPAR
jgi:hypothetical protein